VYNTTFISFDNDARISQVEWYPEDNRGSRMVFFTVRSDNSFQQVSFQGKTEFLEGLIKKLAQGIEVKDGADRPGAEGDAATSKEAGEESGSVRD
jgi:hypothetical protein